MFSRCNELTDAFAATTRTDRAVTARRDPRSRSRMAPPIAARAALSIPVLGGAGNDAWFERERPR